MRDIDQHYKDLTAENERLQERVKELEKKLAETERIIFTLKREVGGVYND